MKQFIEILIQYWKPIVGILFTIAGFIVALIKKKPINDILTDIYYAAINAINSSETIKVDGNKVSGDQKLAGAIFIVGQELKKKYPTLNVERYYKLIEKIIEDILTTPQKHKRG